MLSTRGSQAITQTSIRLFSSTSQQCLFARKIPKVFRDGKQANEGRKAAKSRDRVNPTTRNRTPTPAYPYGPARWYKQSNMGLYGGSRLQFGNNISEDTETKSRRIWRPNIKRKRLWSHGLQIWVRIRVSTRVLRTIDKVGGLDEYLLGDKTARIKELGVSGWNLRCQLMATKVVQRKLNAQRKTMGLPEIDYKVLVEELNAQAEIYEAPGLVEEASEFEVESEDSGPDHIHDIHVTGDPIAEDLQRSSAEEVIVPVAEQAQQMHLNSIR